MESTKLPVFQKPKYIFALTNFGNFIPKSFKYDFIFFVEISPGNSYLTTLWKISVA